MKPHVPTMQPAMQFSASTSYAAATIMPVSGRGGYPLTLHIALELLLTIFPHTLPSWRKALLHDSCDSLEGNNIVQCAGDNQAMLGRLLSRNARQIAFTTDLCVGESLFYPGTTLLL